LNILSLGQIGFVVPKKNKRLFMCHPPKQKDQNQDNNNGTVIENIISTLNTKKKRFFPFKK